MAVLSSTLRVDPPQLDGRRWAREDHVVTGGAVHQFSYWWNAATDNNAVLAARAVAVAAAVADAEAIAVMATDATPALVQQTGAEFRARLREAIRNASKDEACRLAWWLLRRVAAGDITDTQARTVFGLTAQQWATFKTDKLQPRSDAWAALLAATGE